MVSVSSPNIILSAFGSTGSAWPAADPISIGVAGAASDRPSVASNSETGIHFRKASFSFDTSRGFERYASMPDSKLRSTSVIKAPAVIATMGRRAPPFFSDLRIVSVNS